jgi:LacI family transcriptional regulator
MNTVNHLLIAKRLKVSRTTVTRSLANHPSISTETRAKVLQLANELGYSSSPGHTIRRRKLTKNVTIGVLIGVRAKAPGTATFPFVLRGIQEHAVLEEAKIDVYYQNPDEFDPEGKRHRVFGHMRTAKWRGVILIYPFDERSILAISRRISTVATLEDYTGLGVDSIDSDQTSAILGMFDRIVAAGHRKIGFAAWHYPVGGHWTARRFSIFVEGLYSRGLVFNPDWAFNVHQAAPRLSREELADAVARKTREDGVTAWICAADHQAYELIRDLGARGIRVPQDCSICGYDGINPPYGMPQILTARVPNEDIGAAALARVMNRLKNPATPARKILVSAEILPGDSVAAAPVTV